MSWLDSVVTLPVSAEELRLGQQLLDEIRALSSLNAILFDHLRAALVPRGAVSALPRNTHVQSGKQAQSDGRVLELYMGILFHCMGCTVLSCGGGPADGGVDVKVEDSQGNLIVVQCKQYSRAVVGYNVGLQLVGALYTTGSTVGVLITPSTASRDVKALARSMEDIRHGELRLHVWEGEHLARLLGRWSADIMDTRAAMLDDVLGDVTLCDRIISSQPHGYCIKHAICLPRQAGECDMRCSPASAKLSILLSTVHGGEASSLLGASFVQATPTSPVCMSRSISSLLVASAKPDDDSAEVLESISSDEEDEEDNVIVVGNRCTSLLGDPATSVTSCDVDSSGSEVQSAELMPSHRSGASSAGVRATAGCEPAHCRHRAAQPVHTSASCTPSGWPHANMIKPSAGAAFTPSRSRPAVLWTEEEEGELQRCVMYLGVGRWADILDSSALLRARGKTAIKIRDKWKNMRKRQLRPCINV